MLQRDIVGLPTSIYPPDEWSLIEREFAPRYMAETESIFAISNGFLGLRATPEEGQPFTERGTLVNGLHEQWQIAHPESAFGFAEVGQTIIAAPDPRRFHLYVDDEPFDLRHADIRQFERRLDFRTGLLTRTLVWRLPSGVRLRVATQSLTSLVHRHLVAMRYEVEMLSGQADIVVSSQLHEVQDEDRRTGAEIPGEEHDPRRGKGFPHKVLIDEGATAEGTRGVLRYRVATSGMTLACGMDHVVDGQDVRVHEVKADERHAKVVFRTTLAEGQRLRLDKFAAFHISRIVHHGQPDESSQLADRCRRTLDRAVAAGFDEAAAEQRKTLDEFWDHADVQIDGNTTVSQATRWSLFQLLQATARADDRGVPAKGLTGSAYEGHYFWDTEIYALPFLMYTQPRIARNLLRHRHDLLNSARKRAGEVNQRGALFPWRTITGEEASAFFEAGTAQYHINADISYAIAKYVRMTGDEDFMAEHGAEILVETARLYADLGFFKRRADGTPSFHIHGVTGPDEYTTVVDDNAYTNIMAAANMTEAARVVEWLRTARPEDFGMLVRRTQLHDDEVDAWRAAADAMFIPHDKALGITPQDAHFLDLQPWDFEGVPRDKYPLLLHFHPLVIYRYQVIKQADVVLAMFLHDQRFDLEAQASNFEYYDPLTTGDSSLSTSVQSVVASRIGNQAKAAEYFRYGVFMDLANVAGNTGDGVHIAAAGGVWMSVVYGFGGLSDTGERLAFTPRLPSSWEGLRFNLRVGVQRLRVEVTRRNTVYTVIGGTEPMLIDHVGQTLKIEADASVTVPTSGDVG